MMPHHDQTDCRPVWSWDVLQPSLSIIKSNGERTQPWAEPVFDATPGDMMPFTKTCWTSCVLPRSLSAWTLRTASWWRSTSRWWLTWSCCAPRWHSPSSSGSSPSPLAPTQVSRPVRVSLLSSVTEKMLCWVEISWSTQPLKIRSSFMFTDIFAALHRDAWLLHEPFFPITQVHHVFVCPLNLIPEQFRLFQTFVSKF